MASDEYDSSVHGDDAQAQMQRGRQYENHEDLTNTDPSIPSNAALLDRQVNQDVDEILLPGADDFGKRQGMEFADGADVDEDDGGLSGIRPSENEEIDNSGNIRRTKKVGQ